MSSRVMYVLTRHDSFDLPGMDTRSTIGSFPTLEEAVRAAERMMERELLGTEEIEQRTINLNELDDGVVHYDSLQTNSDDGHRVLFEVREDIMPDAQRCHYGSPPRGPKRGLPSPVTPPPSKRVVIRQSTPTMSSTFGRSPSSQPTSASSDTLGRSQLASRSTRTASDYTLRFTPEQNDTAATTTPLSTPLYFDPWTPSDIGSSPPAPMREGDNRDPRTPPTIHVPASASPPSDTWATSQTGTVSSTASTQVVPETIYSRTSTPSSPTISEDTHGATASGAGLSNGALVDEARVDEDGAEEAREWRH